MKNILVCAWFLILGLLGRWSVHPNQVARDTRDCGEPLFLTPLIEDGQIEEAKHLARVHMPGDLGVESYAGYFTVNKTFDSNQFFWYFPSMQDKEIAPIVVWLSGGPGSSSLFIQFMANGPIGIVNNSFARRELHWAKTFHMIYIDNPVGVGFSFTKHPQGYCTDEEQVGEHLYSTITQFFKLFPGLRRNPLYVLGQSYGGKFSTALSYTIHKKNPAAETNINLQGIIIESGFCNPERQLIFSEYLYQIGLIDTNIAKAMAEYESKMIKQIKNQQFVPALHTLSKIVGNVDGHGTFFQTVTGLTDILNYLYSSADQKEILESEVIATVTKGDFRNAVHVGYQPFHGKGEVKIYLANDIMQSVAPWISELLEHYRVLVYSGQVDIVTPYPRTVNYLQHLNFTGAEDYAKAVRKMWRVDGKLAGYVKQARNLTEILVRNAGHLVYWDQPERLHDMITRFTYNTPFTA